MSERQQKDAEFMAEVEAMENKIPLTTVEASLNDIATKSAALAVEIFLSDLHFQAGFFESSGYLFRAMQNRKPVLENKIAIILGVTKRGTNTDQEKS